jgi:hypothetical protein
MFCFDGCCALKIRSSLYQSSRGFVGWVGGLLGLLIGQEESARSFFVPYTPQATQGPTENGREVDSQRTKIQIAEVGKEEERRRG